MITGGCATLFTADPGRLSSFYESLGFERRLAIGRWIELAAPDGFRLALRGADAPEPVSSRMAFGFGIDLDLDVARGRLEAMGCSTRRDDDLDAGVALLHFEDPDGNALYVWKPIKS